MKTLAIALAFVVTAGHAAAEPFKGRIVIAVERTNPDKLTQRQERCAAYMRRMIDDATDRETAASIVASYCYGQAPAAPYGP